SAKEYFSAKKRKLATSFGGGPEFYTYNFLKKNGITPSNVDLVSQNPQDMPAALQSRSVDAISIFDPFAFIAEKRMGGSAVTFTDPTLYSELYVLAARPEQIDQEPELIESILRAIANAGDFIKRNPSQAKNVMQRYTKLDPDVIDGIWGEFV